MSDELLAFLDKRNAEKRVEWEVERRAEPRLNLGRLNYDVYQAVMNVTVIDWNVLPIKTRAAFNSAAATVAEASKAHVVDRGEVLLRRLGYEFRDGDWRATMHRQNGGVLIDSIDSFVEALAPAKASRP
jgi:hypothetical protein